jgi:hypothetical protein
VHSLFHVEYAKATHRDVARPRAVSPASPPHAPPGRVREAAARVLVAAAARVDRESARRALA